MKEFTYTITDQRESMHARQESLSRQLRSFRAKLHCPRMGSPATARRFLD